jgi:hypothetical protein
VRTNDVLSTLARTAALVTVDGYQGVSIEGVSFCIPDLDWERISTSVAISGKDECSPEALEDQASTVMTCDASALVTGATGAGDCTSTLADGGTCTQAMTDGMCTTSSSCAGTTLTAGACTAILRVGECPTSHLYAFRGVSAGAAAGSRCCATPLTGAAEAECGDADEQGWISYESKCCSPSFDGESDIGCTSTPCTHNAAAMATDGLVIVADRPDWRTDLIGYWPLDRLDRR